MEQFEEDAELAPMLAPHVDTLSSTGRRKGVLVLSLAALVAMVCVGLQTRSTHPAPPRAGPEGFVKLEEEKADFENNGGDHWVDFEGFVHVGNVQKLDEYLSYPNRDWLSTGKVKGLLILYVMPKQEWKLMINHVKAIVDNEGSTAPSPPDELKQVDDTCKEKMEKANNETTDFKTYKRIRIVSPLDLEHILTAIRRRLGHEKFTEWFEQTTYDAPKLMDSIMRLRGLGNSIPTFRFDDNVLYNQYTKDDMSMIAEAVAHGVEDYNEAVADPFMQAFVISQKYSGMKAEKSGDFLAWNEAFSTRPNPAFLATPAMVNATQWSDTGGWGHYLPALEDLQAQLDEDTMMAFYGLEKVEGKEMLETRQPSTAEDETTRYEEDILNMGNTYIGAPPKAAATSGAALCLGQGAALDMPPMIHTPLNIMWVDDYLLDQRAKDVFGTRMAPVPPRMSEGRVIKARSLPGNPAKYTLELYMPTLFYGIILDKWILPSKFSFLAKYPQHMPDSDLAKEELKAADTKLGPLAKMEERIRNLGKIPEQDEMDQFKEELWNGAGERMADIYWQWKNLPEPEIDGTPTKTFASLWATGSVGTWPGLEKYKDVETFNKLALGMVTPEFGEKNDKAKSRAEVPSVTRDDMNLAMATALDDLVQTVMNQMEWTLQWPAVVQAIREVNIGDFISDVQNGLREAAEEEAEEEQEEEAEQEDEE